MTLVQIGTLIISLAVVIAQIKIVFLIVFALINPKEGDAGYGLARFIGRNSVLFAFIIALGAMCGSLFFSEIAHYTPCEFCWYQRIFMYSQVFIFGLALIRREKFIRAYGFLLSAIGGVIALNHTILQHTGSSPIPCAAVGQSVSCSKVFVMEFGYITIPMMALTAFIYIIVVLWFGKKYDK